MGRVARRIPFREALEAFDQTFSQCPGVGFLALGKGQHAVGLKVSMARVSWAHIRIKTGIECVVGFSCLTKQALESGGNIKNCGHTGTVRSYRQMPKYSRL